MGTIERRARERQETREEILAAAREMFAEEGYEAVTMRAIAERIEYTPTAIYHHFQNKQALVTELCQQDFITLAQQFYAAARIANPVERIWTVGLAYLQFAIDNPNHYRFMFMTKLPRISPHRDAVGDPERDAYAFFRLSCEEAITKGMLRPEFTDADEVAQILWPTLHGLISLRFIKGSEEGVAWRDLRQTTVHAMEALFRGILKNPSSVGSFKR